MRHSVVLRFDRRERSAVYLRRFLFQPTLGEKVATLDMIDEVLTQLVQCADEGPSTIAVPIRAGENSGRTIAHRNVVRSITALGSWRGMPFSVAAPASGDPKLQSAVLVQVGTGGPIVAATRL